jgi:hypothetical protein
MAAAGTLLADLDSAPGGGDGDLVQKILADMSAPAVQSNRPVPPPMPSFAAQSHTPLASTQSVSMDGRIPTSHMIGNEHPTPADFASAMMSAGTGAVGGVGSPYTSAQAQPQQVYEAPQKNLSGRILDEIKIPFVVALLFFVFSMPPIRILAAHYVPALIKNTGEFNLMGLMGVSAVVGITFWILYRVIAPLLSL